MPKGYHTNYYIEITKDVVTENDGLKTMLI